jgi:hypothetical protein
MRRDFTLEHQRPLFFNPFTWTLGMVCRMTKLPPLAVYYGALAFYAFLLFSVINWFIGIFIADARQRTFAFALCAFSSGLCWLIPHARWETLFTRHNLVPIDYWIAETITFETIFSFPQFALTALLMLLAFGLMLKSLDGNLVRRSVCGGLALFALSLVHTVDVVTVIAVAAGYLAVVAVWFRADARRLSASCAAAACVAAPAFLYMLYLFTAEPVFIEWSKEKFLSPHPLSYIIGYGLVLALALPGLVRVVKGVNRNDWLLAVWVLCVAVLLYAPLSFQRRLSTAVHIPLCILAAQATFRYVLPALGRIFLPEEPCTSTRRRRFDTAVLVVIVLITVPANIVKVASCIIDMRRKPLEFYLFEGDVAAMKWMKDHHNEDAAILASYKSGLYLPAYTGNRVFVGHWSETLKFNEKAAAADWLLYAPDDDASKEEFLRANEISYIYFGNFERMRGRFSLAGAPYLREIYSTGGVRIYRVNLFTGEGGSGILSPSSEERTRT